MNPGHTTDLAAVAAVISPAWLPYVHAASEVAGMALPMLGCAWFALQIGVKLWGLLRPQLKKDK